MKKRIYSLIACILMVSFILTSCNSNSKKETNTAEESKKPKLEDDFYNYVNHEWIQENPIPDDLVSTGIMTKAAIKIDEALKNDLDGYLTKNDFKEGSVHWQMMKFYEMGLDFDRIDSEGYSTIKPYLEDIEKIKNMDDLNNSIIKWTDEMNPQTTPISFVVQPDMIDATTKSLYIYLPSTILPDVSYYDVSNPQGQQILELYKQTVMQLLTNMGLSEEEAGKKIENTLLVDSRLAKYEMPSVEKKSFENLYNPITREDLEGKYKTSLDILKIVDSQVKTKVDKLIFTNLNMWENFDEILNSENIQEIVDWIYVNTLFKNSDFLSQEIQDITDQFSSALYGIIPEEDAREQFIFSTTNTLFSFPIGEIYVEKYFQEEDKQTAEKLTENLLNVYRKRIENNNWLSDDTKEQALKKLDTMVVKMGYPEEIPEFYSLCKIDESKSFLENYMNILFTKLKHSLDNFDKPVNREEWLLPPQMVEAAYNPMKNDITFPAAILNATNFNKEDSNNNYGGIGTIIGHEISHAFDNNGSRFDELGNMKNWWTEEDNIEFEKRATQMIEAFEGLEYEGGKINGSLTVSENIADLGGLSSALEAAKEEEDFNAEKFFTNYATLWCRNDKKEFAEIFLLTDEHAPPKWRVNGQIVNFQEFFDAFNIKEGDKMWRDEKNRLSIW